MSTGTLPVPPAGPAGAGTQHRLWRKLILAAVGLAATTTVCHWPVLSAQALSIDDNQYLTRNPLVQHPSLRSVWRFLAEVLEPSTVRGYYHPLAMISLMLDWAAGGRPDNLFAFHRTSLLLHTANAVLVFFLLHRLTGALWPSAGVAAIFALHPLTVEPVAWVGERKTLLAAFFGLASLLFYVCYTQRATWMRYAASLVALLLALLSKPTAVPIPLMMLLLDHWPLRRLNRRALSEKIPFLVLATGSAVITVMSQGRTAKILTGPTCRSVAEQFLLFCHNIGFYLTKMLWPAQVCGNYPVPDPLSLQQPAVAAGVVLTALTATAGALSARRTRAVYTATLLFTIGILPAMGIVGFTTVAAADKFVYLPAFGVLVLLGWAFRWLWSRPAGWGRTWSRTALAAAVVTLAGMEAAVTRRHYAAWRDSVTLYTHMTRVSPRSLTAHYNLGLVLAKEGKHAAAARQFAAAAEIAPDFSPAQREWGLALERLGRISEAIEHYEQAIRLDPANFNAHFDLARVWLNRNDPVAAAEHYAIAVRLRPSHADAHYGLGAALLAQGRLREAEAALRHVLRLDPQHALARQALEKLQAVLQTQPAP